MENTNTINLLNIVTVLDLVQNEQPDIEERLTEDQMREIANLARGGTTVVRGVENHHLV
jgi:hypothetical protein